MKKKKTQPKDSPQLINGGADSLKCCKL